MHLVKFFAACSLVLAGTTSLTLSWAAGAAHVPAVSVMESSANPNWTNLTPQQQAVLRPLAAQWSSLEPSSKDKWINVASRYPQLTPQEQARVQDRMTQWAKLPPKARGEARLRFQQTRQVSAQERQEKWQAYQALPPDDRKALAQKARRKQKPIFLADDVPGPREQGQVFSGRTPVAKIQEKKTNVVPSTLSSAPRQTATTPTLVKAGRGATTTLINDRPIPPQHQQTGLPKIAATKGFVDPQTLLPKKGPQGAAMATPPDLSASRTAPGKRP